MLSEFFGDGRGLFRKKTAESSAVLLILCVCELSLSLKLCEDGLEKVLGGGVCLALKSCSLSGSSGFSSSLFVCSSLLLCEVSFNSGLVAALYACGLKLLLLLLGELALASFLALCAELIDNSYDAEKNECDEEEVDDRIDEGSPVDIDRIGKVDLLTDDSSRFVEDVLVCGLEEGEALAEGVCTEDHSQDPVDDRLEDKVAEAVNDGGERATYDNTNSHINHVAAGDKGFEFSKKFFHFKILSFFNKRFDRYIIQPFLAFVNAFLHEKSSEPTKEGSDDRILFYILGLLDAVELLIHFEELLLGEADVHHAHHA